MAVESEGDYTVRKRAAEESGLTDGEEDLSDGVEVDVGDVSAFTLYLGVSTGTAVDVTVMLSPDGGTNFYEPDESPVSFASSDESKVEHIPYNANRIRLKANNTTPVKAQLREVV
ncbi:hypothetical protein [Halobacterium noricense]|uniref:hypothetical protein n=1 Tax=Halobacterium noricense TaxID=223182 RepID=UPI001E405418|nr:hypothetical protein [Halobacterium noricense]UHH26457.1 hypothetical protein LT974_05845 [Halobacterium noricense]